MDTGAAAGSSAPAAAAPATASTAAAVPNGAASSSSAPAPSTAAAAKLPKPAGPAALELEAYLHLLVLSMVSSALAKDPRAAGEAAKSLLEALSPHNRRTLDFFAAKAWAALALAHERLPASGGLPSLQPALITAYRTACLRHDEYGQAVLLNLLLRAALVAKDVETAAALVARTEFPEAASPAQFVRFLFYTGRIKAVQLQYSDSYNALMQVSAGEEEYVLCPPQPHHLDTLFPLSPPLPPSPRPPAGAA
jgi:26S proteasome regulatory subunit N3